MATGNVNNRSQMKNIRFPHDVIEQMEAAKKENETIAGFVVTAVRSEIARRQLGSTAEDALASARDALASVRDSASKAGKEIEAIITSVEKAIGPVGTSS